VSKWHLNLSIQLIEGSVLAVGLVLGTTALFLLIGRSVLGEGVIALLYLVPIGWSTTRWGQLPGTCAALTAALAFDYFFIPPFYTFAVGTLEGWLLLIIFLVVATVIIGRIQYGLQRAHVREREALFMYELSTALAGARTPDTVARTLALQLQQMLQASLVQVVVESDRAEPSILASVPPAGSGAEKPDQILPMLAPHRLIGEIRLWQGHTPLPPANGILLQNFAEQGALAIERLQAEADLTKPLVPSSGNGGHA
jgi:two-component system, OmpR family, sensor histidine kinase KdpD